VNELISPIVKKKYVYFLIHILLPILLGGFIYILLRSSSLLMFQWFESIGILEIVLSFRNISIGLKTSVPSWFYYSLPDGLWVYSFTTAILLFGNDFKNIKYWLFIPLVLGPLVEISQFFKLFPGTFDLTDLFFTSIAFTTSILIFNYKNRNNEKQTL